METNQPIKFVDGAHSKASFADQFLRPLFNAGVITPYPSADRYATCYGELCAFVGDDVVATWSAGVPDCEDEVFPGATYEGEWLQA